MTYVQFNAIAVSCKTLESIQFSCTFPWRYEVDPTWVKPFLSTIGSRLKKLDLSHQQSTSYPHIFEDVATLCPHLEYFRAMSFKIPLLGNVTLFPNLRLLDLSYSLFLLESYHKVINNCLKLRTLILRGIPVSSLSISKTKEFG